MRTWVNGSWRSPRIWQSASGGAEVAFAVEPGFQGHGLGTLLLERLAAHATLHGFERFVATTLADNTAMLDVFRQSGYRERTTTADGITEVELVLTMDAAGISGSEQRRHQAAVESVTRLLKPRSVAVIGASRDAQKIGSRILAALKQSGFAGSVFVVHPEAAAIQDVAAVRSPRDLPPGVDLAIIAVPAAAVMRVVEDCASRWVRTVLVVTAGFAESGNDGRMAEDALLTLVRGYGMRMVGPNCMGALNFDSAVRLNASFAPVAPAPGHVALASQSGALGIAVLDLVGERGIGVSSFVSLGNKADLSSNDLLEYWEDDAATRVVLLYLESFGNPRRFARIARRLFPQETHRRTQGGTIGRWIASGSEPYRVVGGQRCRRVGAVPTERRDSRGYDRRDDGHRRMSRSPAAAEWQARGDCDQRRRSGHSCRGCVRSGQPVPCHARCGDARPAGDGVAGGGQLQQPG